MRKLIRNRIKCRCCGDIIESVHVHDFKYCSCKSVAVDGGLEYARRLYKENYEEDIEDLSEWEEISS